MSKLRSVDTAFWSDPFVEDLTANQKLLFLYLITNEKTNMLGIYEVSLRKISFETGLSKEDISNALKGFEKIGKVKYVENYVILVNYMKHQKFNTNMKKSAIDCYNDLPNILKAKGLVVSKSNPLEGFESLLKHYGMVPKVEVEVEVEDEEEEEEEGKGKGEGEEEGEDKEEVKFNFKKSLLNYGFTDTLVNDWLMVRKAKKATNTETAYKSFIKVIEDCKDVDKNIILTKCVEKSWAGVERDWLENAGVIKQAPKPFIYR